MHCYTYRYHYIEEKHTFVATHPTTILFRLLPKAIALCLEACNVEDMTAEITLSVTSTSPMAPCPVCTHVVQRVYSHYMRTLADLPWGSYAGRWQLCVRKFFCDNPTCPRRIFTERLPGLAAPWARRTQRLTASLLAIGLALGGAAGGRLGRRLGLGGSRHTLLRVIRRASCPALVSPQVLGSDIHVMLALRRRSRQSVVTDEELNGTDMVGELLRKRHRLTSQA